MDLEKRIGYHFREKQYLQTAVTHSSYANEMKDPTPYNERQEFLGDAVLSIVVSDYLFKNSSLAEGDLTKLRAALVCEKSLCGFAAKIDLGSAIRLGKGEEMMGGRTRPSILADAFEALIAAIYLDGGMEAAREWSMPSEKLIIRGEAASSASLRSGREEIVASMVISSAVTLETSL